MVAKASALLTRAGGVTCEELVIQLAANAIQIAQRAAPARAAAKPSSLALESIARCLYLADESSSAKKAHVFPPQPLVVKAEGRSEKLMSVVQA